MNCPVDSVPLVMSERQGIEIDYCPQCRGVWLDRGELDKIIERSSVLYSGDNPEPATSPDSQDESGGHGDGQRGRRKRDFFGDLFEFGD